MILQELVLERVSFQVNITFNKRLKSKEKQMNLNLRWLKTRKEILNLKKVLTLTSQQRIKSKANMRVK